MVVFRPLPGQGGSLIWPEGPWSSLPYVRPHPAPRQALSRTNPGASGLYFCNKANISITLQGAKLCIRRCRDTGMKWWGPDPQLLTDNREAGFMVLLKYYFQHRLSLSQRSFDSNSFFKFWEDLFKCSHSSALAPLPPLKWEKAPFRPSAHD